jgi:archaeosortase B (VPXXXP-CTERM-specific)
MLSLRIFVAHSTGTILNALGTGVQVDGTLVSSADFSMIIVNECTGIISMIILLCAFFSYPCKIKGKLLGIAIGMPTLFLLNLIRVVTLFYIGTFLPDFFETTHILVWQSIMILAVIAIWIVWTEKVVHVQSS